MEQALQPRGMDGTTKGELRLQPASCSGAIGSWQGLFRAQCSANEEERCAVIDVGFSQ